MPHPHSNTSRSSEPLAAFGPDCYHSAISFRFLFFSQMKVSRRVTFTDGNIHESLGPERARPHRQKRRHAEGQSRFSKARLHLCQLYNNPRAFWRGWQWRPGSVRKPVFFSALILSNISFHGWSALQRATRLFFKAQKAHFHHLEGWKSQPPFCKWKATKLIHTAFIQQFFILDATVFLQT